MKEIWKDVKDYEGIYQVSNCGNIRSLDRIVEHSRGSKKSIKGKMLSQTQKENGYMFVHLHKSGKKKMAYVHRVVAQAFLKNEYGLPEVNHKDENKQNNNIANIEWCTRKYNASYGTGSKRAGKKKSKKVLQKDNNDEAINIWDSARGCARKTGYSQGNISSCCRGEIETAYGYRWEYV